MIRSIVLFLLFLVTIAGLEAQALDYVHPKRASFQHGLVCAVFKTIGLKNSKESSGADNFYTRKKPLKKLTRKYFFRQEMLQGRPVYHFKPQNKKSALTVIYLHGGAYTANFMKQHWQFISKMLRKNEVAVLAPDYPLAPESDWKKNVDFVLNCYRNLLKTTPADSIIFMGDSAGGGLALVLAMAARDANLPQPKQIVMLAPWLDLQMQNPEISKMERKDPMLNINAVKKAAGSYATNEALLVEPYVSPIFGDIKGLAPMSVFIGGRDVLKADCEIFRDKCKVANIPVNYFYYPKMMHVWMLAAFFPESKKAFSQISSLIASNPNASRP